MAAKVGTNLVVEEDVFEVEKIIDARASKVERIL